MCYSAQVTANLRKLRRYFPQLDLDYEEAVRLLRQRMEDPSIRIARAFEENFMDLQDPRAAHARELIEAHRKQAASQWERDLFAAKKRLADAELKLQVKVTKTAQNEVRIASNKIEDLTRRLSDLHRTESKLRDERIFAKHYTAVIIREGDRYLLSPMRYLCRPEGKPAFYDEKYPGCYNARRDSLEGFWRGQFRRRHAIAVVESFFENVQKHDLEQRELAPGEKPQNVVLRFKPQPPQPMLVACIWSHWTHPGEPTLRSFAIITDDPPPEVAAAGHDRCPVNLKSDNVSCWLSPEGRSREELFALLADRKSPYYAHEAIKAA